MKTLYFVCALALIITTTSFYNKEEWTPLLDKDLSKWENYLSFKHKVGYKGEAPKDEQGNIIEPIGYNKNVNNVFSIIEENGAPVLKVSGEIYGCVYTKEEFENYHLKLQVKWGEKKWEPRLDELKDSGILYHSQGEAGVDYWRAWMLSQEFQIIENGCGDYWNIANAVIDIRATKPPGQENYVYSQDAPLVPFGAGTGRQGFCQRGKASEKPMGEWNTLELITCGDKSIHIVNGKVVMALENSRYLDGDVTKPLTKGRIQLQSEAAEVYFKDIKIRNIKSMPKQYAKYFQ